MAQDSKPSNGDATEFVHQWSARKIHPIVLLYVVAVFAAMALVAFFLLHSVTAVTALVTAAVGSLGALVPGINSRMEYRLNGHRLEQRPVDPKKEKGFSTKFQIDQISHIVPMRHGFKFYKHLDEPNGLKHFWNMHVSDGFSGEVHVEKADRERVLDILTSYGIAAH